MQARPVSASICTTFGLYLVFVSRVMSAVPVWTNSHSKDNKYINSNNNTSSQGRVRNVKSLTKTITFWFFRQSPALCSAHVFLFCCLFFKWTSAQGLNSYKDPLWKKNRKQRKCSEFYKVSEMHDHNSKCSLDTSTSVMFLCGSVVSCVHSSYLHSSCLKTRLSDSSAVLSRVVIKMDDCFLLNSVPPLLSYIALY